MAGALRVKLFGADWLAPSTKPLGVPLTQTGLESQMNTFLGTLPMSKVVDITQGLAVGGGGLQYYYGMIIYQEA